MDFYCITSRRRACCRLARARSRLLIVSVPNVRHVRIFSDPLPEYSTPHLCALCGFSLRSLRLKAFSPPHGNASFEDLPSSVILRAPCG